MWTRKGKVRGGFWVGWNCGLENWMGHGEQRSLGSANRNGNVTFGEMLHEMFVNCLITMLNCTTK